MPLIEKGTISKWQFWESFKDQHETIWNALQAKKWIEVYDRATVIISENTLNEKLDAEFKDYGADIRKKIKIILLPLIEEGTISKFRFRYSFMARPEKIWSELLAKEWIVTETQDIAKVKITENILNEKLDAEFKNYSAEIRVKIKSILLLSISRGTISKQYK